MAARSIADLLVTLLAMALYAGLGSWIALPIATHLAASADQIEMTMTSALDPLLLVLRLSAALGAVPLLGLVPTLVYRARRRAPPPPSLVLASVVAVSLAAGIGMGLRYAWLKAGLESVQSFDGVTPMVSLAEISVAGWTFGGALAFAFVASLGVAVTARPRDGDRQARGPAG
ncbi:MAG: hypothetical protein AB7S26_14655 [Sandaracinaceae bacterium]